MFEKTCSPFLTIFLLIFGVNQVQSSFTCAKDGLYAYNSCTQFYQCAYTNTFFAFKVLRNCPSETLFDQNLQICDWAYQVKCANGGGMTTTSTSSRKTTTSITIKPIVTSASKLTTTSVQSISGYYVFTFKPNDLTYVLF